MKKLISSLMIAVTLFTAMPAKKAEAGMIMWFGDTIFDLCNGMYQHDCGRKVVTPILLTGVGVFAVGLFGVAFSPFFGIAIVLDADGSLPKEKLEASLATRYSFINDNQAISDLADAIKSKASSQKPVDGKIEVKLSKKEVELILEPTGLLETNPKDVAKLIKELN